VGLCAFDHGKIVRPFYFARNSIDRPVCQSGTALNARRAASSNLQTEATMRTPLVAIALLGFVMTGCVVETPAPAPVYIPPGTSTAGDLGARALPGYHVQAGGAAEMPSGDLGYVVTANGAGGYRVAWTDTVGSAAEFHGSLTTDGEFDARQFAELGQLGSARLVAANEIDFDSVPGSTLDGFDLVSSTDPIYLDARVNGSTAGFDIIFADGSSGAQVSSAWDPVAFTSP
jgi:hypothetical protein